MNILLVDDSKLQARHLNKIAEKNGHILTVFKTGEEALDRYESVNPDMVILDVDLPGMKGYEVAEKIRELNGKRRDLDRYRWTPIIFLSGLYDDYYIDKCIQCGGDDYMSKPPTETMFSAKLIAFERLMLLQSELLNQMSRKKVLEENLERIVDERTKELSQEIERRKDIEARIEEAHQNAVMAKESKGLFLANMSHEIRTPLNALMGMLRLLEPEEMSINAQRYVDNAVIAGNSMLSVINNILDFEKIEAGKLSIEIVNFELADVFNKLAVVLQGNAYNKKIELIFDIHPDVPLYLKGDPLRLSQILINLGTNAIKFTQSGEVVISVSVLKIESSKVTLCFSVKDTGIGLTEQQVGKLFKNYSQADESTSRKFGGTGLGLSICKQLTQLMGGDIWVESQLGKGSLFNFSSVFEVISDGQVSSQGQLLEQVECKKVLLIEKNKYLRKMIQSNLELAGFEVHGYELGQSAIESLQQQDLDLYKAAILEYDMEPESSLNLSQQLDKIFVSRGKRITFIFLSSLHEEPHVRNLESREMKVDAVIKPFLSSHLIMKALHLYAEDEVMLQTSDVLNKQSQVDMEQFVGLHLLVAEDNEINQEVIRGLLNQWGIKVNVVSNGKEVLNALEKEPYHGIFLDLQMPVMDGRETLKILRKQNDFKNLPILAMSASALQAEKEEAIAAGMDDYVVKPIDCTALKEAIEQWMVPYMQQIKLEPTPILIANTVKKNIALEDLSLPGLDIKTGLSRLGNNQTIYLKMVTRFGNLYEAQVKAVLDAAEANDIDELIAALHKMKTTVGTLGALELFETVKQLEGALRDGMPLDQDPQQLYFLTFQQQSKEVVASVKELLEYSMAETEAPKVDIKILVHTLSDHLANFSTQSREVMQQLLEITNDAEQKKFWRKVEHLILAYDYQEALQLIAQWQPPK